MIRRHGSKERAKRGRVGRALDEMNPVYAAAAAVAVVLGGVVGFATAATWLAEQGVPHPFVALGAGLLLGCVIVSILYAVIVGGEEW